jgi:hypothetical protein
LFEFSFLLIFFYLTCIGKPRIISFVFGEIEQKVCLFIDFLVQSDLKEN